MILLGAVMLQRCAPPGQSSTAKSDSSPASFTQEQFLLPPDYRGPVVVLYDQGFGVRPASNLGTLIYEIPANGVVRSQLPEPPLGTKVTASFRDNPKVALRTFSSCSEMRSKRSASDPPATCWIESTQGSDIPPHVAFIVTDWSNIPRLYTRAAEVIDSVVFRGKFHGVPKWEEPKAVQPVRRTSTI